MRRVILELAGDIFLVGLGCFFLWVFLNIYFKGGFMFAVEPNTAMLVGEVLFSFGLVLLGLNRYFDDLKRKKEAECGTKTKS